MRKLKILKAALDLFWYFSVIGIIAMIIFIPYIFISNSIIDIPIKIQGERILIIDWAGKMALTIGFVAYIFFAYGIFKLRKVLELFSKKIIFEEDNIILLNQVGKSFLFASVFTAISLFVYTLFQKSQVEIEISSGFNSFLFTASLALFFMVLSEVFNMAKSIKHENDLTI